MRRQLTYTPQHFPSTIQKHECQACGKKLTRLDQKLCPRCSEAKAQLSNAKESDDE